MEKSSVLCIDGEEQVGNAPKRAVRPRSSPHFHRDSSGRHLSFLRELVQRRKSGNYEKGAASELFLLPAAAKLSVTPLLSGMTNRAAVDFTWADQDD